MITLQRLCAAFLVHFGVNLWTLNDELMSAFDLAAVHHHVSLARFLDAAASRAFVDDRRGTIKLCRRAADDARRRLRAQRQSAVSRPCSVDLYVDHRLRNTSQVVDGWRAKTLPDGTSTSLSASSSFLQTQRLANLRLFPTATVSSDSFSHSESTDVRSKRRRFWPRSARRMDGHVGVCVQPSTVAAAARQLLLMTVRNDSRLQSRVVRQQLRLSTLDDTTTDDDNNDTSGVTSRCGIDSQFYCRPRVSDDVSTTRKSEVSESACASERVSHTSSKHETSARRRHRQTVDVISKTATDKMSDCSNVYCLPADCIQRPAVISQPAGHSSGLSSHQSSRPSSKSGLWRTSINVNSDDRRLRQWLESHSLAEYWSVLATEKVDLDTLTLLGDDDLRQLGVPLGPRRRLLRAVSQLSYQSEQSPADNVADSSASDNTRL